MASLLSLGAQRHALPSSQQCSSAPSASMANAARCSRLAVLAPTRRRCRQSVVTAGSASNADTQPGISRRGLVLQGSLLAASSMMLSSAMPQQAAAAAAEAAGATAAAAAVLPAERFSAVMLQTLADCELAVSVFPTFTYKAAGGGGQGKVVPSEDGLLHVVFDPSTLNIPPINYEHASILGIPVPPPLNIAIVPKKLEGTVDPWTGRVDLEFLASFEFTAGPLYRAAPLIVGTTLTTESSAGVLRSGTGQRLRADGRARLVGVARVPVTEDAIVNTFLQLPTDALAVLSAELKFT